MVSNSVITRIWHTWTTHQPHASQTRALSSTRPQKWYKNTLSTPLRALNCFQESQRPMEPLSISMPLAKEVPRSFGGMAGTLFTSLLFALLLFWKEVSFRFLNALSISVYSSFLAFSLSLSHLIDAILEIFIHFGDSGLHVAQKNDHVMHDMFVIVTVSHQQVHFVVQQYCWFLGGLKRKRIFLICLKNLCLWRNYIQYIRDSHVPNFFLAQNVHYLTFIERSSVTCSLSFWPILLSTLTWRKLRLFSRPIMWSRLISRSFWWNSSWLMTGKRQEREIKHISQLNKVFYAFSVDSL